MTRTRPAHSAHRLLRWFAVVLPVASAQYLWSSTSTRGGCGKRRGAGASGTSPSRSIDPEYRPHE